MEQIVLDTNLKYVTAALSLEQKGLLFDALLGGGGEGLDEATFNIYRYISLLQQEAAKKRQRMRDIGAKGNAARRKNAGGEIPDLFGESAALDDDAGAGDKTPCARDADAMGTSDNGKRKEAKENILNKNINNLFSAVDFFAGNESGAGEDEGEDSAGVLAAEEGKWIPGSHCCEPRGDDKREDVLLFGDIKERKCEPRGDDKGKAGDGSGEVVCPEVTEKKGGCSLGIEERGKARRNGGRKEAVGLRRNNDNGGRCLGDIFVAPGVNEVKAFVEKEGLCVDAATFVDFYESHGWCVGRTAIKNWKATARLWHRRAGEFSGSKRRKGQVEKDDDEAYWHELKEKMAFDENLGKKKNEEESGDYARDVDSGQDDGRLREISARYPELAPFTRFMKRIEDNDINPEG